MSLYPKQFQLVFESKIISQTTFFSLLQFAGVSVFLLLVILADFFLRSEFQERDFPMHENQDRERSRRDRGEMEC